VNHKHTVQPVMSNSRENDSYDPSVLSESQTYGVTSDVQFQRE